MTQLPATITASVHPDAIHKASRFYTAVLDDILVELFQNARRAGADTITVVIGLTEISVQDNGAGIHDPASLLQFGTSAWDEKTRTLEDAAGMGFFSLAQRGCRVTTRAQGQAEGWTTTLTPDVFDGKAKATVTSAARETVGTMITFGASLGQDGSAVKAVQRAAEYCPILVECFTDQGLEARDRTQITVEQEGFLKDALFIKQVGNGRIGIVGGSNACNNPATINFHGATVRTNTPYRSEVLERAGYHALYDLHGDEGVELVLPARKDVVQNAGWAALQKTGLKAIYEYIAAQPSHTLSYKHWKEARDLGIELPEAAKKLTPYQPGRADHDALDYVAPTDVRSDAALCVFDDLPVAQQCLARAFAVNNRSDALFEPNAAFEGYGWYDDMQRLESVTWRVTAKDGSTAECSDLEAGPVMVGDACLKQPAQADLQPFTDAAAITAILTFSGPEGDTTVETLPADCLIYGEGYAPEDLCIFIDGSTGFSQQLEPDDLSQLIYNSWYSPSDDAEAESYQTQSINYEIASDAKAVGVLKGADAALTAFIQGHAYHHLAWTCPRNRRVRIDFEGYDVNVSLDPPALDEHATKLLAVLKQTLSILESHMRLTATSSDGHDRMALDAACAAIKEAEAQCDDPGDTPGHSRTGDV
ncbi:MAG: hypothetical protein AAF066_02220 [Pseudomonadota bacterium]